MPVRFKIYGETTHSMRRENVVHGNEWHLWISDKICYKCWRCHYMRNVSFKLVLSKRNRIFPLLNRRMDQHRFTSFTPVLLHIKMIWFSSTIYTYSLGLWDRTNNAVGRLRLHRNVSSGNGRIASWVLHFRMLLHDQLRFQGSHVLKKNIGTIIPVDHITLNGQGRMISPDCNPTRIVCDSISQTPLFYTSFVARSCSLYKPGL